MVYCIVDDMDNIGKVLVELNIEKFQTETCTTTGIFLLWHPIKRIVVPGRNPERDKLLLKMSISNKNNNLGTFNNDKEALLWFKLN